MNTVNRWMEQVYRATLYSFTGKKIISTVVVSVLAYSLLVLSSFPEYSYQIFLLPSSILTAVKALSLNIWQTTGATGFVLTILYGLLIGVSATAGHTLIKLNGISNMKNASGILPGFLAGGCAGCGAGILGLMGYAGAVALLPFNGNLVRLAGIGFLLYFLVKTGDPRTCEI